MPTPHNTTPAGARVTWRAAARIERMFWRSVDLDGIASRLDVPVVPVRIQGLDQILHHTWKFPVRGKACISFGAPMSLKGNDYAALAARVEEAVRQLPC